jgi:outer membrane protein assembly factor BamD
MQGASRDQTFTKKAIEEFDILRRQYPDSKYAQEAENRLRVAHDQLAASEMDVGRYYLKRKNYLAATNRFKSVVADHQNTKHVEEALQRLVECYMALGIRPEAQTAAAILGHNFPNSPWYKDAYALLQSDGLEPREDTGSWLSQVWKKTVSTISGTG